MLQCIKCEFVYLGRQPSWGSKKAINEWRYSHALALDSRAKRRRLVRDDNRCLDQISRYCNGGLLLDIGCGGGSFAAVAQRRGWDVYGVELDCRLAGEAARRVDGKRIHVGTTADCEFRRGIFDVVAMKSVLEHLPDPCGELARVRGFLKPGGLLFILVPNIESFEARLYGARWFALSPGDHLSFYSQSTLRRLAEEAGFTTAWMVTTEDYRDMLVGAGFAIWRLIRDGTRWWKREKGGREQSAYERSTGFFATLVPAAVLRGLDMLMEGGEILMAPLFSVYARALERRGMGACIRAIFVNALGKHPCPR